jgi:hypothetical protein
MNQSSKAFTSGDDDFLIKRIASAKDRVVFVAPALRSSVAGELATAIQRLAGRVTIVLDIDAGVCRLGYGDIEGLELIPGSSSSG